MFSRVESELSQRGAGSSSTEGQSDQPKSCRSQQANPEAASDLDDLREKILGILQEVQDTPAYAGVFEGDLDHLGLLSALEELGIMPVVENPNPFNVESDEDQHDQWWKQHPEEAGEFHRDFERREDVLKHLYFGAILGHLAGARLSSSIEKRKKSLSFILGAVFGHPLSPSRRKKSS